MNLDQWNKLMDAPHMGDPSKRLETQMESLERRGKVSPDRKKRVRKSAKTMVSIIREATVDLEKEFG